MRGLLLVVACLAVGALSSSDAMATEPYPRVEQTESSAIATSLVRETGAVGTTIDDVTPTVSATPTMVVWGLLQNLEISGGDDLCYTLSTSCASSGLTCNGTATDGIRIYPRGSQPVKYAPKNVHLCIVGSAAGVAFHMSSEVIP